jgi:hypothetical protein
MLLRTERKHGMSKIVETSPNEKSLNASLAKEALFSAAFRTSQTFPQILALRATPRLWQAFRIFLGIAGAALIVLPLGIWNAWLFAPVGLVFFLVAVLLPPVTGSPHLTSVVKHLHAYASLDGGKFSPTEESSEVRLLLAKDRIWALNDKLQPMFVIPTAEFNALQLRQEDGSCLLELGWGQNRSTLFFDGLFAERRAHEAASALQRIVHTPAIVSEKPKARAAGA